MSEIMTLPVLMKDEKTYSDCVDVLDQLEEWTHEVYYASGPCKDPHSSATNTRVEVATRPDQPRAHISPVPSDADPLNGMGDKIFALGVIQLSNAWIIYILTILSGAILREVS